MGARREAESVSKVLVAFLESRTWAQAELARRVGVQTRTVAGILRELELAGVPFQVEREPPHVYWSVEKGWFPTGVLLPTARAASVARLLARMPQSSAREGALTKLLEALPASEATGWNAPRVEVADPVDPHVLSVLEDAAAARVAVRIKYFSVHRGDSDERHVSVHRFVYGRHTRFVATCHRSRTLKWFRVDRVEAPVADPGVAFLGELAPTVDGWIRESVDGFRSAGAAERHACVVRDPEARWVRRNAPDGVSFEVLGTRGVRLTWYAAAVEPIARFVVGLGAAARVETERLRVEVEGLARGALEGVKGDG